MKPTPTQADVRASLRGRLEDVIEELEAVRGVMRDELPYSGRGSMTLGLYEAKRQIRECAERLA